MTRVLTGQRGAALVVALLAVALVAVLAAAVTTDHQLTVKRAGNRILAEQAQAYLLGGEELARVALRMDANDGGDIDARNDVWAQEAPPYPIEGGWLSGRIVDLQGRFNINSLLNGLQSGTTAKQVPYTEEQNQFVRLLTSFVDLQVSRPQAIEITEAVIDWLDANQETTGFGGMEDSAYYGQDVTFKTADQPMMSVTELRAVGAMTTEIYQRLLPHVTVWPREGGSINPNTATVAVLQALNPGQEALDFNTAQAWYEELSNTPVEELEAFKTDTRWSEPLGDQKLVLKSEYFLYSGRVELGNVTVTMSSVLHRLGSQVRVVQRSSGQI